MIPIRLLRKLPLGAMLSLILAVIAPAKSAEPFVDTEAFDFLSVIPNPPDDASLAGRADLETVFQLQKDQSPAQRERVARVANQSVFSFAAPILGDEFNAEALPVTAAFFHEVTQQSYTIAKRAKSHWARPRPYWRDPSIVAFPRASRSASYPSGHASDAATWIAILEELFPEQTGAFENALREVMWCRVLGASHYPTDTQAGAILGRAIGQSMLKNAATQEALQKVRSELRENGFLPEANSASTDESSTDPAAEFIH